MRYHNADQYLKNAKKYRAPAVLPAFKHKVGGGKKITDTYATLYAAWRAGAVRDFYFGTRADDDPTIVWHVDSAEYAKADLAGVHAAIAARLDDAGIASVEVGEPWVGYPSLTITHTNGVVTTESYDGIHKSVATTATLNEVAA